MREPMRCAPLEFLLPLAACSVSGSGGGSDSPGTIQLLETSIDAGEGTFVNLRVERSGGSKGVASVEFATVDGTAVGGVDFTRVSGTLFWPDGTSGNRTITIPIADDGDVEPLESFTVVLSNATVATLGTDTTAAIHILDDDAAPLYLLLSIGHVRLLVPARGSWAAAEHRETTSRRP